MRVSRLSIVAALAVICSLFMLRQSIAAEHHWVKLGARQADSKLDKDVIEVGKDEGRYVAIKIAVEGGDIILNKLTVVFGDGEKFSPDLKLEFREGSRSREIDLPGKARIISRIEFVYHSEHKHDKGTVIAFGRK